MSDLRGFHCEQWSESPHPEISSTLIADLCSGSINLQLIGGVQLVGLSVHESIDTGLVQIIRFSSKAHMGSPSK